MNAEIILGAIVVVPLVLLMVLRINAALVFLSLCLGDVLVQFVGGDASSLLTTLSSTTHKSINAGDSTIKLVLLLFPVVLTAIFMIKTVRSHGKLALNALPAAGVGLLGALLVVPLLPVGLSTSITVSNLWQQALRAQDLIVGSSALVCLFVLWMQRPKTGGGEEKKHGKHKG